MEVGSGKRRSSVILKRRICGGGSRSAERPPYGATHRDQPFLRGRFLRLGRPQAGLRRGGAATGALGAEAAIRRGCGLGRSPAGGRRRPSRHCCACRRRRSGVSARPGVAELLFRHCAPRSCWASALAPARERRRPRSADWPNLSPSLLAKARGSLENPRHYPIARIKTCPGCPLVDWHDACFGLRECKGLQVVALLRAKLERHCAEQGPGCRCWLGLFCPSLRDLKGLPIVLLGLGRVAACDAMRPRLSCAALASLAPGSPGREEP
jgi:hypothetical protein